MNSHEPQIAVQEEMQRMLREVKQKMKPHSKNELIRVICALLVDNYIMKKKIEELAPPTQEQVPNEIA